MTGKRNIPAPSPDPETLPFWMAAEREELVLPRCRNCGRLHWYPRGFCPFCLSSDLEWTPSEGFGRIYSCTVFRRAEEPYIVAYVDLDEGLRLLTNIVADEREPVAIGQRVQVAFMQKIPFFKPCSGS